MTNQTRIEAAARRALDALDDLIRNSADPGSEAFGAQWELGQALLGSTAPTPAVDRNEFRDRIRRAVCEADGFAFDQVESSDYQDHADALLAMLPAPADWAAVLLWAADRLDAHPGPIRFPDAALDAPGYWWDTRDRDAAAGLLRHWATEAEKPHEDDDHSCAESGCTGEPTSCTCAVGGDCFVPAGHYADCPDAAPAVVAQPGKEA